MTDKLIQIQNLNKILLRLNDLETEIVKIKMRFVRNTTNEDNYKNEPILSAKPNIDFNDGHQKISHQMVIQLC